jgi:cellulose synthase/poly-beta-1,6-N-acetylglucosamine synthase-like glycosyltransferase
VFQFSVFPISDLTMPLSVIICSHNPRPDYLRRVLGALKAQTLPKERWELLFIDNASKEPLAEKYNLSWQSYGRCINEEKSGLTLLVVRRHKTIVLRDCRICLTVKS